MRDDLQAEFRAAGEQYARTLREAREHDRQAAQARQARRADNAARFTQWAESVFTANETDVPDPGATTTTDTAADLMAAIEADTNKENQ